MPIVCFAAMLHKPASIYMYIVVSSVTAIILPCPGTMVSSVSWNDQINLLAAIADNRFVVWYHPAAVYVDKDLLSRTVIRQEGR